MCILVPRVHCMRNSPDAKGGTPPSQQRPVLLLPPLLLQPVLCSAQCSPSFEPPPLSVPLPAQTIGRWTPGSSSQSERLPWSRFPQRWEVAYLAQPLQGQHGRPMLCILLAGGHRCQRLQDKNAASNQANEAPEPPKCESGYIHCDALSRPPLAVTRTIFTIHDLSLTAAWLPPLLPVDPLQHRLPAAAPAPLAMAAARAAAVAAARGTASDRFCASVP